MLRLYQHEGYIKTKPEGAVLIFPSARDITNLCSVSLAYPENLHAVEVTRAAGQSVLSAVTVLAVIMAQLLSDQHASFFWLLLCVFHCHE